MDRNRIAGNWKRLRGTFKQKWGRLTASDSAQLAGWRDQLEGSAQQRYGVAKDFQRALVRKDLEAWLKAEDQLLAELLMH